jgi:hypothetical protein
MARGYCQLRIELGELADCWIFNKTKPSFEISVSSPSIKIILPLKLGTASLRVRIKISSPSP